VDLNAGLCCSSEQNKNVFAKKPVSDNKQLVSIYENFEKYFKVLILVLVLVLVLKNKNEKTEISCSF